MYISQKNLWKVSFIYMYLPAVIMMLGWSAPWFSVPAVSLSLAALYTVVKKIKFDQVLLINRIEFVSCLGLILVIAYYSGWGGAVPQSGDWHKHNAILRDLILRPWPVLYKNHGISSMLTYYLGQYIVPSVAGKVFLKFVPIPIGEQLAFYIAEIAMAIWNIAGMAIVVCHIQILVPSKSKITLVLAFLLFGNPLLLGKMVYNFLGFYSNCIAGDYHWLARNALLAQYTTNYAMLRWVFPQCIVPWIATSMLLEDPTDIDCYLVIGLPVILFATLPFLGIVISMAVSGICQVCKRKDIKSFLYNCFSLQNMLVALSIGVFSFCYFISFFLTENKPDILKLQFVFAWDRNFIVTYIVFCLSTFGLYACLLLIYNRRDVFLNTSIATLVILPLFKLGLWNDLVMRVSIPALFILCIYVLRKLFCTPLPQNKKYRCFLLAFYLIGIYYPARELGDVIETDNMYALQERADSYGSMENYANPFLCEPEPGLEISEDIVWNYYTYDAEDCIFLKTIGKRHQDYGE